MNGCVLADEAEPRGTGDGGPAAVAGEGSAITPLGLAVSPGFEAPVDTVTRGAAAPQVVLARIRGARPVPFAGGHRRVGAGPELTARGQVEPGVLDAVADVDEPSIWVSRAGSLCLLPGAGPGANPVDAVPEAPHRAARAGDGRTLGGGVAADAVCFALVLARRIGADVARAGVAHLGVGAGAVDLNGGVVVVRVDAGGHAVPIGVGVRSAAAADAWLYLAWILGTRVVVVVDAVAVVIRDGRSAAASEIVDGEGERQHRGRVVRHDGDVLAEEGANVLAAVRRVQLHLGVGRHDDPDEGSRELDGRRAEAGEAQPSGLHDGVARGVRGWEYLARVAEGAPHVDDDGASPGIHAELRPGLHVEGLEEISARGQGHARAAGQVHRAIGARCRGDPRVTRVQRRVRRIRGEGLADVVGPVHGPGERIGDRWGPFYLTAEDVGAGLDVDDAPALREAIDVGARVDDNRRLRLDVRVDARAPLDLHVRAAAEAAHRRQVSFLTDDTPAIQAEAVARREQSAPGAHASWQGE